MRNTKSWVGNIIMGVALVTLSAVTMAVAVENRGPAEIIIDGGKTGKIQFPHHRHQQALDEDCMACHNLFPQKAGAIDALKKSGALKKKTVMNQCQKCHRKMAKEGAKTGPTGCKKCHSLSAKG